MVGRREFGLLVAGAATLGCGRGDESKPTDPFALDAPALFEFSPFFVVELVEPGSEPRERLRYVGRAPERRIELADWMPEFDDSPPLTLIVSWTGVEAEGEAYRYTYEVIDLEGELATRSRMGHAELRMLAGQATGTGVGLERVFQTRGISAVPNPALFIDSLAVPLPAEPLGRGAVWTRTEETRSELSVAGSRERDVIVVTTTRRYFLVERRGNTLSIDCTITSVTDKPRRVPGSKTASGRLVVALSDPLPQSGDLEVLDTTSVFGFKDDPQRSRIRIRTRE